LNLANYLSAGRALWPTSHRCRAAARWPGRVPDACADSSCVCCIAEMWATCSARLSRNTRLAETSRDAGHIRRAGARADASCASPTTAADPPPPAQRFLAYIQPFQHACCARGRPDWWGWGTFLPASHLTLPARPLRSGGAVECAGARDLAQGCKFESTLYIPRCSMGNGTRACMPALAGTCARPVQGTQLLGVAVPTTAPQLAVPSHPRLERPRARARPHQPLANMGQLRQRM
jgi:hypothetical protein